MAATGAVALYHVEGVTPEAVKEAPPIRLTSLEKMPVESERCTRLSSGESPAPGCRRPRLPTLLTGRAGMPHGSSPGSGSKNLLYVFASQGVIDANRIRRSSSRRAGQRSMPTPAWWSHRSWNSTGLSWSTAVRRSRMCRICAGGVRSGLPKSVCGLQPAGINRNPDPSLAETEWT